MSTIKIAQFKTTDHGVELTCYFTFAPSTGYIQTSEWVEVEFPPISSAALLEQQVLALEETQKRAFDKYTEASKAFEASKAALQTMNEGEKS